MPPHKPHEKPFTESGTWQINKIRIGKFVLNPMTWLVLCLGSLTPFGQWTFEKAGIHTTSRGIEELKKSTEENKAQIEAKLEKLNERVSALLVEFERLRLERQRTAGQ